MRKDVYYTFPQEIHQFLLVQACIQKTNLIKKTCLALIQAYSFKTVILYYCTAHTVPTVNLLCNS